MNSRSLGSDFTPQILDIGGEGRHAHAWNLNPSPVRTFGDRRGSKIPRVILGRANKIPAPDHSIRVIISERTPLTAQAYREIGRIIAPGGFILLRHAILPGFDPHRVAYRYLPRRIYQRSVVLVSRPLQETLFYNDL